MCREAEHAVQTEKALPPIPDFDSQTPIARCLTQRVAVLTIPCLNPIIVSKLNRHLVVCVYQAHKHEVVGLSRIMAADNVCMDQRQCTDWRLKLFEGGLAFWT